MAGIEPAMGTNRKFGSDEQAVTSEASRRIEAPRRRDTLRRLGGLVRTAPLRLQRLGARGGPVKRWTLDLVAARVALHLSGFRLLDRLCPAGRSPGRW